MSLKDFENMVKLHAKHNIDIELFFDVETLTYNIEKGKKNPKKYKSIVYAMGVDFQYKKDMCYNLFFDFNDLFDTLLTYMRNDKGKITYTGEVKLYAHNSNRFDNHFLRMELIHYYGCVCTNMYLKNAINNNNTKKITDYKTKKSRENNVILEKRVKAKTNLEMTFFLHGVKFTTIDNLLKTNASIDTLGKKLLDKGLITEDYLKTSDLDYEKFNKYEDMDIHSAKIYAYEVFKNLTNKEKIYIRNDLRILSYSKKYYSLIYPDFDYSLMTLTSNISKKFNDNDITSIQMLNTLQTNKKFHIKYTDYFIGNENFYDYLKSFYKGGLNFYNQDYVGKLLEEKGFGIDISSSYPYSMHNFLIPTFLSYYKVYDVETELRIVDRQDKFYLYRMTQDNFNDILFQIDSTVIRQMLVKYYSNTLNEYVNINSNTIRLINKFIKKPITHIEVLSMVVYDCIEFGSKDFIFENYFIKTQGKLKNKIIMEDPYNYTLTNEPNDLLLSEEEIYIAKVYNNGGYGIPALRPYFNLFRYMDNNEDIENQKNGFKNKERNIIFSIFVTSVSFLNLLTPLSYLPLNKIDKYFWYTDTDSLYMSYKAKKYLPDTLFDDFALGKWTIDVDNISKFYILNHKKYSYLKDDGKIEIRSGGVPHSSFSPYKYKDFVTFIDNEFSDGVILKTLSSIYNEIETITIYKSETKLEKGSGYPSYFTKLNQRLKENLFEEIKKREREHDTEDYLYIESELFSISSSDINYQKNSIKNKKPLYLLKYMYDTIRGEIV